MDKESNKRIRITFNINLILYLLILYFLLFFMLYGHFDSIPPANLIEMQNILRLRDKNDRTFSLIFPSKFTKSA